MEKFNNLENKVGENISLYGFYLNDILSYEGILNDVTEKYIKVNNEKIPFESNKFRLYTVFDENNIVVYQDVTAINFIEYSCNDVSIDRFVNEEYNFAEIFKYTKEKNKHYEKTQREIFFNKSFKYIKPELINDWKNWLNENYIYSNFHAKTIIDAVITMMEFIHSGMSYEEAEKRVYDVHSSPSGAQIEFIISIIGEYYVKGQEYLIYRVRKNNPVIKKFF